MKRDTLLAIGILAILLAGLAYLGHTPPTVLTISIVIPAWIRTGGATLGLAALALLLRSTRDRWHPYVEQAGAWLEDD